MPPNQITNQFLELTPRWRTVGFEVRAQKNNNSSQGGYVLGLCRRNKRRANRTKELVRSNGEYARLGFRSVFATKEDALRTFRVRAFRHFVTYVMDRRLVTGAGPAPLGASPAPTPNASPAKAGRPPKRGRTGEPARRRLVLHALAPRLGPAALRIPTVGAAAACGVA